jgi:hypothetical protein
MWEPWPLTTLWASTACNRDIFTFTLLFTYLLIINHSHYCTPHVCMYNYCMYITRYECCIFNYILPCCFCCNCRMVICVITSFIFCADKHIYEYYEAQLQVHMLCAVFTGSQKRLGRIWTDTSWNYNRCLVHVSIKSTTLANKKANYSPL